MTTTTAHRSFRPFRCPSCRHALRFGAAKCGRCHDLAPAYNRRSTYVLIGVFSVMLLAWLVLLS